MRPALGSRCWNLWPPGAIPPLAELSEGAVCAILGQLGAGLGLCHGELLVQCSAEQSPGPAPALRTVTLSTVQCFTNTNQGVGHGTAAAAGSQPALPSDNAAGLRPSWAMSFQSRVSRPRGAAWVCPTSSAPHGTKAHVSPLSLLLHRCTS